MKKSSKPRLAFNGNDHVASGPVTTVRLGRKWLDIWEEGHREVVLLDSEGKKMGTARLLEVAYVPFHRVTERDSATYHNGSYMSRANLARSIESSYANAKDPRRQKIVDVEPGTMVTIISFVKDE